MTVRPNLAAAALFAMLACGCASDRGPSQHDIVVRFASHAQDFERLRSFVERQPQIFEVYDPDQPVIGQTQSGKAGKIPSTSARVVEIRRLMRVTGVVGILNDRGMLTCTLWVDSDTWGPGAATKGVVYAATPPRPLSTSIDSPSETPKSTGRAIVFAGIAPNWYAWYNYGG